MQMLGMRRRRAAPRRAASHTGGVSTFAPASARQQRASVPALLGGSVVLADEQVEVVGLAWTPQARQTAAKAASVPMYAPSGG